jgi:hypothetical protein
MTLPKLLGLTEIAELYGVDKNTANGWRRRSDFPAPAQVLRMGPVWTEEDLLAWREPVPTATDSSLQVMLLRCAHCGSDRVGRMWLVDQIIERPLLETVITDIRFKLYCEECLERTLLVINKSETTGSHIVTTHKYPEEGL